MAPALLALLLAAPCRAGSMDTLMAALREQARERARGMVQQGAAEHELEQVLSGQADRGVVEVGQNALGEAFLSMNVGGAQLRIFPELRRGEQVTPERVLVVEAPPPRPREEPGGRAAPPPRVLGSLSLERPDKTLAFLFTPADPRLPSVRVGILPGEKPGDPPRVLADAPSGPRPLRFDQPARVLTAGIGPAAFADAAPRSPAAERPSAPAAPPPAEAGAKPRAARVPGGALARRVAPGLLRELPAEADADTPLFRLLAGRGMFAAGRSPRVVRGRGDEVSLETPVDVAGLGPAWLRYFPAFWTDGAYRPDSVVLAARGSGRGWPGAMVFAVASSRGAVRLLRRDGAGPLEELRVESEQFVSVVHPDASGGESPPEPAAPAAPPDTLDFRRRPGYGMRRGLVFAYRSQRDAGSQVGWEVSVPGGDGSSTVLFYRGPAGAPEDDGTYYSRPDDEGLAHRLGSSQAMDLGGARTLQVGRERRLLIPRRGARGELVDPANGRAYAFRASGGCGAPRLEPSGGGGGSAGAPEAASKPAGGPSPRSGAPPGAPPPALPRVPAPPGPSAAPSSEPRPESPANGPAPAPAVVAPPPRDVSVPAAASALAQSMAGGDGDKVAELAKRLAGLPGGPAALAALLEPGRPGLLLLVRALSYGNVGPAGPQALARLCGLLASADGELRPELVRTLLSQSEGANAAGGPNGVLLAGAADPAMELLAKAMPVAERLETVKLLGSLGRGAASTRWAEPLRKALAKEARSPEGETWREAAVGLARMPTVEAGQSVRELLQESEKIPGRTVALLQAFSHADIGEAGGGTIEGMRLLLNSKDPAVRLAAVEALLSHSEGANRKGHLNHPFYQGAVDEVIALLSGTADDALRLRAIALLGSMSRAAGWRPSSDQATIDFVRNVGRAGHTERWLRAIKAALEKQKGTLGASGTAAQRELEKSPPLQDLDAVPGEDVWALGGGVYELRRGSRAGRLAASANVGDRKVGVMISGLPSSDNFSIVLPGSPKAKEVFAGWLPPGGGPDQLRLSEELQKNGVVLSDADKAELCRAVEALRRARGDRELVLARARPDGAGGWKVGAPRVEGGPRINDPIRALTSSVPNEKALVVALGPPEQGGVSPVLALDVYASPPRWVLIGGARVIDGRTRLNLYEKPAVPFSPELQARLRARSAEVERAAGDLRAARGDDLLLSVGAVPGTNASSYLVSGAPVRVVDAPDPPRRARCLVRLGPGGSVEAATLAPPGVWKTVGTWNKDTFAPSPAFAGLGVDQDAVQDALEALPRPKP